MNEVLKDLLLKMLDYREAMDLEAQIEMAFWAKWMFWATLFGMIISVGAVAAAYISLRETRKALKLSQKAAADAREIGEHQTQAYVHAASASFGSYNNLIVNVKNGGQTPATHFCVNATAKLVARGEISKSISFSNDDIKIWSALGAGDELTVSLLEGNPAIEQFSKGRPKDTLLLISGQIIYCTIFNHDHVTQFAFYVDPTTPTRFRRPTANLVTFHRLADGTLPAPERVVEVLLDEND